MRNRWISFVQRPTPSGDRRWEHGRIGRKLFLSISTSWCAYLNFTKRNCIILSLIQIKAFPRRQFLGTERASKCHPIIQEVSPSEIISSCCFVGRANGSFVSFFLWCFRDLSQDTIASLGPHIMSGGKYKMNWPKTFLKTLPYVTNSFSLDALRGAFRLYPLPQQVIPGN